MDLLLVRIPSEPPLPVAFSFLSSGGPTPAPVLAVMLANANIFGEFSSHCPPLKLSDCIAADVELPEDVDDLQKGVLFAPPVPGSACSVEFCDPAMKGHKIPSWPNFVRVL
jgi:hypothetical protein